MRKSYIPLIFAIALIFIILSGCNKKTTNPIVFPRGTFPDTVVNLQAINSQYDDYNLDIYQLAGSAPVIFSSNRKSAGGQFDLEQADISFTFNQTDGSFQMNASISDNAFIARLIQKAVTPGNDFGPSRYFSTLDGYDYLVVSSVNAQGNLDLYYLKNFPIYGSNLPDVEGPTPISLLNTGSDEAYFCFDMEQDSVYFSSDRGGNSDIFVHKKPPTMLVSTWFKQGFTESVKADSINSSSDDKCPLVFRKIMLFTSNRPGGFGGYDLYYSVFKKGKWGSPVNLGADINSSADEYRPVIGYHPDFTNLFLMFSSNRPGGKGGFDLYFTGFNIK